MQQWEKCDIDKERTFKYVVQCLIYVGFYLALIFAKHAFHLKKHKPLFTL